MNVIELQRHLPREMIPEGLAEAASAFDPDARLRELTFEHHRAEGRAFCRRTIAVYALWHRLYGAEEESLTAMPAEGIELREIQQRRRALSNRFTDAIAVVSTTLRIGPAAADHAVECAIGFIERLPLLFGLIDSGRLPVSHARELLSRSRALHADQVGEFDATMSEELSADELRAFALPALRERADHVVFTIDPGAAERRRRASVEERCIRFRPAEDGMAKAFALLTAHEAVEINSRIDAIADTVCGHDPRTHEQRRADGLTALVQGLKTLGCRCGNEGCELREALALDVPDGVVVRYKTLIHVVAADSTLTGEDDRGAYMVGHGAITAQHARDIAGRPGAVRRPFGTTEPKPDTGAEAVVEGLDMVSTSTAAATDSHVDAADTGEEDPGDAEPSTAEPTAAAPAPAPAPAPSPATPDPAQSWPTPPDPPASDPPTSDPAHSGAVDSEAVCPRPAGEPADGGATEHTDPPAALWARSVIRPDGSVTEPGTTEVGTNRTARGATGYRLSTDQRLYLLMMMPLCVFPNCPRRAERCEFDHRQEYDHRDPQAGGPTTVENSQPLCKAHHFVKTSGLWIDTVLPDGRILWTSVLHHYDVIVDPLGMAAQLFPELAAVRWTYEPGRGHRDPAVGEDRDEETGRSMPRTAPTRRQREHARRKALRARNARRLIESRQPTPQPTTGSALDDALIERLRYRSADLLRSRRRLQRWLTHGPLPRFDHPVRPPAPPEELPPF